MSPGLLRAMTDKQWDRVGLALGDEIRLKNHLATQETTNAAIPAMTPMPNSNPTLHPAIPTMTPHSNPCQMMPPMNQMMQPMKNCDIATTLLPILGLPPAKGMEGVNLLT